MKKLLFIVFLFTVGLYGQEGRHEKIKALKTTYITEQLSLTSAEAEKFWPIYNSYDKKFHAIRKKERREIFKKLQNDLEFLTDAEANILIEQSLSLQSEGLELRKRMISELRKVISPKKIITLKKAEDDFKRELLDRYRHHRRGADTKQ